MIFNQHLNKKYRYKVVLNVYLSISDTFLQIEQYFTSYSLAFKYYDSVITANLFNTEFIVIGEIIDLKEKRYGKKKKINEKAVKFNV